MSAELIVCPTCGADTDAAGHRPCIQLAALGAAIARLKDARSHNLRERHDGAANCVEEALRALCPAFGWHMPIAVFVPGTAEKAAS